MFKNLNITYTIRRNKARANGEVPIYMRINVNGTVKEVSTGEKVLPEKWDSSKSQVKGRDNEATRMNNRLKTVEHEALEARNQLLQEGVEVTAQSVKDRMTGKDKLKKAIPVMTIFEEHNEKMEKQVGNNYAESTFKKYRTCKKHMKSFLMEEYGDKAYPISKVDQAFLEDFADFLMSKEDPCSNNSARKYLTNFQKVVNLARRKKILTENPYDGFKMKYEQRTPTVLTLDEVYRIHKKQFGNDRLDRVKDVFVFACFTGFAFCDIEQLKKSDIQVGEEGEKFVRKSRAKTGQNALVPLLNIPLEIIEKYDDDPETVAGNLLPVISNQKTNAYLKEIANICGIDKKLTFHAARHTCGTILLNLDMQMESVRQILGHADLRMTQHYAKLSQTKINEDMAKVREKLL